MKLIAPLNNVSELAYTTLPSFAMTLASASDGKVNTRRTGGSEPNERLMSGFIVTLSNAQWIGQYDFRQTLESTMRCVISSIVCVIWLQLPALSLG